jgi:hypothetical protein
MRCRSLSYTLFRVRTLQALLPGDGGATIAPEELQIVNGFSRGKEEEGEMVRGQRRRRNAATILPGRHADPHPEEPLHEGGQAEEAHAGNE